MIDYPANATSVAKGKPSLYIVQEWLEKRFNKMNIPAKLERAIDKKIKEAVANDKNCVTVDLFNNARLINQIQGNPEYEINSPDFPLQDIINDFGFSVHSQLIKKVDPIFISTKVKLPGYIMDWYSNAAILQTIRKVMTNYMQDALDKYFSAHPTLYVKMYRRPRSINW